MAKEKKVIVDITAAINHYKKQKGRTIGYLELGKVVFKDEKIKADASIKTMLSLWNVGDYSAKKCTVVHLARICKFTGISIENLVIK